MMLSDAYMNDNMSNDTAIMYTYGRYLMHGGDPEKFLDLDMDQIQVMYTVDIITQKKKIREINKMLNDILKRM